MSQFKLAHILCAASLLAIGSAVSAQNEAPAAPAEQTAMAVAAPVAAELMLNAGVPITLAVAEEVNSSTHEAGDMFKLAVLNDVMAGQTVVIPKGTPATAEVTWRTGKGAFGKSGKLEFLLRSIELNGKSIPIIGEYRQEGDGNTVATVAAVALVWVAAPFITGKRARLPAGRELMAQLAQPVPFSPDGKLTASFDSAGAMAAAEAKTALGQCKAAAKAISNAKKQEKARKECYSKRME